jgi:hypothetical protein
VEAAEGMETVSQEVFGLSDRLRCQKCGMREYDHDIRFDNGSCAAFQANDRPVKVVVC